MDRKFNVTIERDEEGYYVARVPELRGCHTQARSHDAFIEHIKEAIELCLEVEGRGDHVGALEFTGTREFTAS